MSPSVLAASTHTRRPVPRGQVALVTGASSGFGQLTAARLVVSGYRVFGASRRAHTSDAPGVELLVMDVRCDESVQAGVAELLSTEES